MDQESVSEKQYQNILKKFYHFTIINRILLQNKKIRIVFAADLGEQWNDTEVRMPPLDK
jgi:hypothetical protein